MRSLDMVRFQCGQIMAYLAEHPGDTALFATTNPAALLKELKTLIPEYDLALVADGVRIRAARQT